MTATAVVLLSSHRRRAQVTETCKACRPGFTCYPHQLAALADRVRAARDDVDPDALLVARADLEAIASDVLAVIERVTADYLPDERSAR